MNKQGKSHTFSSNVSFYLERVRTEALGHGDLGEIRKFRVFLCVPVPLCEPIMGKFLFQNRAYYSFTNKKKGIYLYSKILKF